MFALVTSHVVVYMLDFVALTSLLTNISVKEQSQEQTLSCDIRWVMFYTFFMAMSTQAFMFIES